MNPDFKILKKMMTRERKFLEQRGIMGPSYCDSKKTKLLFTDGYAGVVLQGPPRGLKELVALAVEAKFEVEVVEERYTRMLTNFNSRKKRVEVSWYTTTAADLRNWLRLNTEYCPLCGGKTRCAVVSPGHVDTPEREDALNLHYGLVGSAAVDRRRLEELLAAVNPGEDEEIVVVAFTDHNQYRISPCVQVVGAGWELFVMGIAGELHEGETRFHMHGKYKKVKLKTKGPST